MDRTLGTITPEVERMLWLRGRTGLAMWLLLAVLLAAAGAGGYQYLKPSGPPPKRATLVQRSWLSLGMAYFPSAATD